MKNLVVTLVALVAVLATANASLSKSDRSSNANKVSNYNLSQAFILSLLYSINQVSIEEREPCNESLIERGLITTQAKVKDIIREHKAYTLTETDERKFNGTISLAYMTPVWYLMI